MTKTILALAALTAIGFAGTAFAGQATTGPAAMTDAEMDAVTAGEVFTFPKVVDKASPTLQARTNGFQGINQPAQDGHAARVTTP